MIIKEHPILFSTLMVQAILEGRKSQTRRILKPQPNSMGWCDLKGLHVPIERMWKYYPYGQAGDKLWVRETFVLESDLGWDIELPTDRPIKTITDDYENGEYHLIPHYRATEPEPNIVSEEQEDFDDRTRWQPSIFMPRWASRITLEITDIRVERLQEISEDDCLAEGINVGGLDYLCHTLTTGKSKLLKIYSELWDSINRKRSVNLSATNGKTVYEYSWIANPWVWVIEFKKV